MPQLIVLNGPPGIGKSTIARRYVQDHPLALCLEQDVVRALLGGWRSRETASGQLARELCLSMAAVHLRAGLDVVVPQLVALPEYLTRLSVVASEAGAAHVEILLLDDVAAAERRFHMRLNDPLWSEHQRVAAELIEDAGGFAFQYDRLIRGVDGRDCSRIRSVEGDVEATYREVLTHVGGAQRAPGGKAESN